MRSVGVSLPSILDDALRLSEVSEQVLVEALVAQPTAEALDEAILHRFAGCDVVPFDGVFLLRGQDGI